MTKRVQIIRPIALTLGIGTWLFAMLSLASFHPTDWPAHHVFPYGDVENLCGSAGAFFAYHCFKVVGQGVFPVLFFTGVALAMLTFRSPIDDLWLRASGLLLLSIAFAGIVHQLRPGSLNSFPEGHGGVIGIAIAGLLKGYFSSIGSGLILALAMLIGLLLVADDLVLRAPGAVNTAVQTVREHAPHLRFNIASIPRLPSLPKFITRDAARERGTIQMVTPNLEPDKADVVLKRPSKKSPPLLEPPPVELAYDNDEPVPSASDDAFSTADDRPSAAAEIPEPAETVEPTPEVTVRPEIVVKLPSTLKPRQVAPPPQPKELGEYNLPDWSKLDDAEHGFTESQEQFVREKAAVLEQALKEFSIDAHVVEIDTGPVITMYELSLAPGIKVAQITALSNDIARALAATSVRIVAPVPGKHTVGIEVPNAQKEKVRLKELMQLAPEAVQKMAIPLYLGKDASGEPLITDLTAMPHCLIAGTTGSGKSVCINSIIMSIMYTQRPDMVKLILVDPKVVEMAAFKDIPHLMAPVINEAARACKVLEWACEKMDERYEFLAEAGVRNIRGYNSLSQEELIERFKPETPEEEAKIPKKLPYIVIIIDELADLMMTSGKEVEAFIVRLAQKSRAVGIHLIVATQRPSANVVTGLIKSNMPSRIAFRVQSKMDSRIVLDQNGADLLLGQGDMLFMPPGASKPIRSQGTYIDDKEMHRSVSLVKELAEAQYEPELVQIRATGSIDDEAAQDELFDDAVRIVLESKRGSVSLLQRKLTIGYSRASRLIEAMAVAGIVGEYKGSQAREALITLEEWDAMKAAQQADAESGMSV